MGIVRVLPAIYIHATHERYEVPTKSYYVAKEGEHSQSRQLPEENNQSWRHRPAVHSQSGKKHWYVALNTKH